MKFFTYFQLYKFSTFHSYHEYPHYFHTTLLHLFHFPSILFYTPLLRSFSSSFSTPYFSSFLFLLLYSLHQPVTVIILGAFGGRLDQEMANIHALYKWHQSFDKIILLGKLDFFLLKETSLSTPKEISLSTPKESSLLAPKEASLSAPQEASLSPPKETSLSTLKEASLSSFG